MSIIQSKPFKGNIECTGNISEILHCWNHLFSFNIYGQELLCIVSGNLRINPIAE
nr:MAG TPA: hypothetical protein [Bacteriophage sp.]